jgi:hypothetical protein
MKRKLLFGVSAVLFLSGCTKNFYNIKTKYENAEESIKITSEVEGKATIGKIATIYERVFSFVNKELKE